MVAQVTADQFDICGPVNRGLEPAPVGRVPNDLGHYAQVEGGGVECIVARHAEYTEYDNVKQHSRAQKEPRDLVFGLLHSCCLPSAIHGPTDGTSPITDARWRRLHVHSGQGLPDHAVSTLNRIDPTFSYSTARVGSRRAASITHAVSGIFDM